MRAFTRLAAIACACAGVITIAGPASVLGRPVSARLSRVGTAPLLPPGAHIAGAAATATPLHLTIALRPRDPAALQAFAAAVSTAGSPQYRDYVTPAQFAERFGATPATIQAVEGSLRAHGLRPGAPSPNGLSIRVTTTAATAAHAFAVSFAHVATRSGAGAIVNQQAPALDASIVPDVQAVLGLDTLAPAKPLIVRAHEATAAPPLRRHVVTGGPQPCAAASSAGSTLGGFTADQIASAYGFSGLYTSGAAGGAADEGAGQSVAILELEPYDPTDIAAYQQCYGTSAQLGNVTVDGGPGTGSGSGEAALDIENVIGLAPKANIAVYEGPNSGSGPFDTFSAIISQRIAQVVTASWGQCELINGFSEAQAENTLFQEAAAQGQTILSASGDDGAEDCFPANPTPQVDDPASQPFVTGVGGTRVNSLGPRPSETVWNEGPAVGAGGGGVSTFWNMPSYQSGAPSFLHVINAGSSGSTCAASSGDCREVPDVSAESDPATGYLIYWNGNGAGGLTAPKGWQVVGGTSGAAPAWAALIALANASSACNGTAIGFANPALYNAAATGYAADFNDTTTGNNDLTGVNGGQFAAGAGYDMATGLGSPNGFALAGAICTDAIALANPGAQRSVINSAVSLQIHGTDTRGASVRFSATGLPTGLTINPSSGKVIGHPRRLGTSTVTVIASDAAGTTARASFAWTIQTNPTLSRMSLSGVGTARPKLFLVLAAGRDAPKLKTVSVSLPGGLHFARSRATLIVTGRGERHVRYSATLKHGALVLTFRTPAQQLHVTVAYPRLQAGPALVSRLAGHLSSPLAVTVRTTDALKRSARISAKVRPRS